MITRAQLKIYERYNGDGDMLIRIGSDEEKEIFGTNEWNLIEDLLLDLSLIKSGLASDAFVDKVNNSLQVNCDSQETVQYMKSILRK